MYRNPITRPLAVAFLQKQLTPDEWAYHFDNETGRVIATNKTDPSKTKDVTPGATAGQAPVSRQEREVENYYRAGIAQGLTEEQAKGFALNKGKLPSEERTATQIHELKKAEDSYFAATAARKALDKASDLSGKAFQGTGASQIGTVFANLPSWVPGHEAGVATGVLANTQIHAAMTQLQDAFGRNPSDREGQIMIKLQGAVNEPLETRNQIIKDAKEVFDERVAKNKRQYEQMQSGEYFKKGGGGAAAPPTAAAAAAATPAAATPAATGAKPSLSDFMVKARAANPGVADGELAKYWKQKYGG